MELIIIIIFIILGFIISLIKSEYNSPEAKGSRGEENVSRVLNKCCSSEEYKIINNITLPTKYGTTQIDHIVVSRYGIFVIETKNMSGWILGSEDSEQWTKASKRNKYTFRNPLIQNNGHILALQHILFNERAAYISIVVFSNEAEIRFQTKKNVIYLSQLPGLINSFKEMKLTDKQVDKYYNKIIDSQVLVDKEEHLQNIQKAKEHQKQIQICPQCGGHLFRRNGKYGPFYGCEHYPSCRYTRKITGPH